MLSLLSIVLGNCCEKILYAAMMPLIAGKLNLISLLNLSGPNLNMSVCVSIVSPKWLSMMSAQWSFVFSMAYRRSQAT